ncbi:MAG: hypothetical protein NTZ73_03910 [Candidatus Diapherotrites archaeon]|nr:hypothetical protein [Candidatus Diapherotrites archaeon]
MGAMQEERKVVANLLMRESLAEAELEKKLRFSKEKLGEVLAQMLRLKLISKDGASKKYSLKQEIIDEVLKRRKIAEADAFKIRLRVIIDFQAIEKTLLKKHMDKVIDAIKKEKMFTVYSIERAKTAKDGEMYSSFIEVNLSVKNFSSVIRLLFYYGASSIEVLKPDRIAFSQYEFQEGLMDLAAIFQSYSRYFMEHLNKEDLDKFYKKIYE